MKRRLALALSVLITTSVFAQTDPQTSNPKTARRASSAPVSKQLEDMKDAISAQQQQIQQLQQQIQPAIRRSSNCSSSNARHSPRPTATAAAQRRSCCDKRWAIRCSTTSPT